MIEITSSDFEHVLELSKLVEDTGKYIMVRIDRLRDKGIDYHKAYLRPVFSLKIRAYIMCARKCFDVDIPEGWTLEAFERFDFIECAIYTKSVVECDKEDEAFHEEYKNIPKGWIEPVRIDPTPK